MVFHAQIPVLFSTVRIRYQIKISKSEANNQVICFTSHDVSNGLYFLSVNFSNSNLNSSYILKSFEVKSLPLAPPISIFSSLRNSCAVLNKFLKKKIEQILTHEINCYFKIYNFLLLESCLNVP
jgi:hypothetical protein